MISINYKIENHNFQWRNLAVISDPRDPTSPMTDIPTGAPDMMHREGTILRL